MIFVLMPLLPVPRDRAHYSKLFKEDHHWLPAINAIIKKHGLVGIPHRGILGSHIVYRVGHCWIKLMAPIFAKDMPFEISGLKAVANRLSVPTPAILAEGCIEEWPYVIVSHVEGKPVRDLWKTYSMEAKKKLASQMAQITKEISRALPDQVIQNRFQWNDFIADMYLNCKVQHSKKELPEAWLNGLDAFMKSFNLSEFQISDPVFLHADLTFDHFLVDQNGDPKVTGVIDMADCQVGHPEYELVAPCTFIFKGEPQALKAFLLGFGFQEKQLNQRFSEKLLAWTLLHRYFSLDSWFKDVMDEIPEASFSKLAARVFPLK